MAQDLRVVSKTAEFTDYEFVNDRLKITAPEYLMVPYHNGDARYRIIEQDIISVTADSSQLFYVQHPDRFLISNQESPLIETGMPGEHRGHIQVPLTIHVARQSETTPEIFQVLRRLRIRVFNEETPRRQKSQSFVSDQSENPLSSGQWYKIPVPDDDIYILNRDYLKEMGVNVSSIDPENIQIWTTRGYELPHKNSDPREDTLRQIPIIVEGETDGRFNEQDRVLFFANGPDRIIYNEQADRFEHRLHPYTNNNYVFLTIGSQPGMRLSVTPPSGTPSRDVSQFRDFLWLEEDREKPESRLSSGTQWFGQPFDVVSSPSQTIFTDTLAGFQAGTDVEIWLSMAARATVQSQFLFTVNGSSLPALPVGRITSTTSSVGVSARIEELRHTIEGFSIQNDIITINATFNNPQNTARGWVNWIRVRADRELQANNNRLKFHPPEDGDGSLVRYRMKNFESEPVVLDITNPVSPVRLQVNPSDDHFTVTHFSDRHRRFISSSRFRPPPPGALVPNQNLRNLSTYPDYVIITASEFMDEARRLADYRNNRDGLTPVIVTQTQIFNEFNGGVPDFVALRDYVKFLYDRGAESGRAQPEYLLLFGATTYDYKEVIRNPNKRNIVFTYQSEESISRINSYGSDDFFGFMGDDEGTWPRTIESARDLLDIGIGRLPVQNTDEARLMVDKIQSYEDPRSRGDWKSLFTFIADDDVAGRDNNDRDLHILNADGTSDEINLDHSGIRLEKIYQISYPYVNTSAGRRVPEATRAIVNRINDGTLVLNFSGHGSEQFLTDQRLFTEDDINRLNNRDRLSIMVTATCDFGRFDNTEDNSGAEKMILHPDGGLIASFTTTRVVFTTSIPTLNFGLNIELTREMTRRGEDGRPQRLGDIFRKTKNTPVGSDFNARKFILLGDPALKIGLPESRINITHLDGNPIQSDSIYDLRALDRVSISGYVSFPNDSVNTSFNGEASIRVLDAKRLIRYPADRTWATPDNCFLEDCGYFIQTDALFNGRVSVSDGRFHNEFIIPKDVSYSQNPGRIHAYAHAQNSDAVGASSSFRISGQNPEAENDQSGPNIEIYLNDELFTDGGIVNDSPKLITLLSDHSGINTTGAGVGHEIIATIEDRDNPANRRTLALNEFYQSNLDDFSSGRVEYPLNDLSEGHYRLRVRAWDVFNNMGESEINFQVLDSQELQIRNIFNYPNPMHNFTRFVFEHNQPPGRDMDIIIRIYTLTGSPVATIREKQYPTNGNKVQIEWFGRDNDNHRLATGTYLYHVQVRTETDEGRQTKDELEKLVILR
ncbi:MAG: type IX secretion system sortase PorU [Balneolales bacterium]